MSSHRLCRAPSPPPPPPPPPQVFIDLLQLASMGAHQDAGSLFTGFQPQTKPLNSQARPTKLQKPQDRRTRGNTRHPRGQQHQCGPLDLSVKRRSLNHGQPARAGPPLAEPPAHPQEVLAPNSSSSKLISSSTSSPSSCSVSSDETISLADEPEPESEHTQAEVPPKPDPNEVVISSSADQQASTLTRRRQKHRKLKSHLCLECGRAFSRSDMLTRHSRLHSGLKPYQCSRCKQVFSRSDHLSTHERTHTGEKPYQCQQCAYSACRRDMITRHMRTHNQSLTGIHHANSNQDSSSKPKRRKTNRTVHRNGELDSIIVY